MRIYAGESGCHSHSSSVSKISSRAAISQRVERLQVSAVSVDIAFMLVAACAHSSSRCLLYEIGLALDSTSEIQARLAGS